MFEYEVKEELVVVGPDNFIEFVEGLKTEGVDFVYRPMGPKGIEDPDARRKIKRLYQWCMDINDIGEGIKYYPIYIRQEDWNDRAQDIKTFSHIISLFKAGGNE